MGVPGVANVSIWGLRDRELQVRVDPQELNIRGAALDEVVKSAGRALWEFASELPRSVDARYRGLD